MLKNLLKFLFGCKKAKAKKKRKKQIRRFFRRVFLLALLGGTSYMAFAHRKLILAKLLHKPLPEGDRPGKCPFWKKKK